MSYLATLLDKLRRQPKLERFPEVRSIEYAPCADGVHHTSYMLLPAEPGRVCVMPESNFLATTPEHQAEIRGILAQRNFVLDLSA